MLSWEERKESFTTPVARTKTKAVGVCKWSSHRCPGFCFVSRKTVVVLWCWNCNCRFKSLAEKHVFRAPSRKIFRTGDLVHPSLDRNCWLPCGTSRKDHGSGHQLFLKGTIGGTHVLCFYFHDYGRKDFVNLYLILIYILQTLPLTHPSTFWRFFFSSLPKQKKIS